MTHPDRVVGKVFVHIKTSGLYRVTGYSLNTTNNNWALHYDRVDEKERKVFSFTRDMAEFMDGRFMEVK